MSYFPDWRQETDKLNERDRKYIAGYRAAISAGFLRFFPDALFNKAPAHCCAGAVCCVFQILPGTVKSESNRDPYLNMFLKKLMICLKNSISFCQNGI